MQYMKAFLNHVWSNEKKWWIPKTHDGYEKAVAAQQEKKNKVIPLKLVNGEQNES